MLFAAEFEHTTPRDEIHISRIFNNLPGRSGMLRHPSELFDGAIQAAHILSSPIWIGGQRSAGPPT